MSVVPLLARNPHWLSESGSPLSDQVIPGGFVYSSLLNKTPANNKATCNSEVYTYLSIVVHLA